MRLRSSLVGIAVALGALAPVAGPGTPACAAEEPHAALVIDKGAEVLRLCVDFPDGRNSVTGVELIELSGVEAEFYDYGPPNGLAVCVLDGLGRSGPCLDGPPPYWISWHGDGDGGWVKSTLGAGNWTVGDGAVEGWVWGSSEPPRTTLESVCGEPKDPSPAPTPSATPSPSPSPTPSSPGGDGEGRSGQRDAKRSERAQGRADEARDDRREVSPSGTGDGGTAGPSRDGQSPSPTPSPRARRGSGGGRERARRGTSGPGVADAQKGDGRPRGAVTRLPPDGLAGLAAGSGTRGADTSPVGGARLLEDGSGGGPPAAGVAGLGAALLLAGAGTLLLRRRRSA